MRHITPIYQIRCFVTESHSVTYRDARATKFEFIYTDRLWNFKTATDELTAGISPRLVG